MKKLSILFAAVFPFMISCVSHPIVDTTPQPSAPTQLVLSPESKNPPIYQSMYFEIHLIVEGANQVNVVDGVVPNIPTAPREIVERFIPITGYIHATNAFLVRMPGLNILVDTGFGRETLNILSEIGLTPDQIDVILITHLHGDHIGGLQVGGNPVFPNARVYINSLDFDHFTKVAPNQGAINALNAYGQNVITFEALPLGSALNELLPGISPFASYGHTPGHTGFLIGTGNDKIVIAGDFLHVQLVQFPHPEINARFDMDQNASAASRRQIFEFAVQTGYPIAGMHILTPGIGHVERDGNGFRFIPLE